MTRSAASLPLAVALLALVPAGVSAQAFEPRTEYEELIEAPKPVPAIPPELRDIASAPSADLLEVKALNGGTIAIDISWYEPDAFELFGEGRYLGFSFGGYEAYGYMLVDRAMTGEAAVIGTGQKPAFSSDGRFIAAVEMSDSAYGNLEGVALWEVLPRQTVQRFFTDAVPYGWDWRIDRWADASCVLISAIGADVQPASEEEWEAAPKTAPRQRYSLSAQGSPITLRADDGQPHCTGN